MAKFPIVKDYMDTTVPTVSPEMDIFKAVAFLLEKHVTGAPVVDQAGNLVGMLTEKDCLKVMTMGLDADVPKGTVAQFMTKEVIMIPPHMDVYYAAGIFLRNEFRRLSVVENGKLVGAITRFDLLRAINANLFKT